MYHILMLENQTIFTKKALKEAALLNLSSGQPRVLEFLKNNDGAMQKDIAQACLIEPSSVSSVLSKMEKDWLITRHINADNKRSMDVTLTQLGKEMAQHIEDIFNQFEKEALADFSESEKETLLTLLKKVNDNLTGRGRSED